MLIEQAILTALFANASVKGVVADRIYYVQAPQGVTAPYVVFFKVSGPRVHSHDGASGLAHPRFQFSCFAKTYAAAKQIAGYIQTVLQGYSGTLGGTGGVTVRGCFYENETDLYEPDTGLFHIALDFYIWHKE